MGSTHPVRSSIWVLMLLVAVLVALPCATQAQEQNAGRLTIFLADPELGVLGSYSDADASIYFEARSESVPASMNGLSVRLLDSQGRTLAVAGHSMDQLWLSESSFDAQDAIASQRIAGHLPAKLATALADPAFVLERTALSSIAVDFATAPARLALQRMELPVVPLARQSNDQTSVANLYARAAVALSVVRESSGVVKGRVGSTHFEAMERRFPLELDEEGTGPRVEIYARLLATGGRTLASEFGGDSLPEGWSPEEEINNDSQQETASDPAIELGAAVFAVQTLSKSMTASASVRAGERSALLRLAHGLRDELLPRPAPVVLGSDDAADDGSIQPEANRGHATNIQIWKKRLARGLAEHSGTTTLHYVRRSSRWVLDHTHTYCNHGTCPRACSDSCMVPKCTYYGPPDFSFRHAPSSIIPAGQTGAGHWHSCHTSYSLNSWRSHNCHDDSWTQLQWIQGQGYLANPGRNRCNDIALYRSAPNCSD